MGFVPLHGFMTFLPLRTCTDAMHRNKNVISRHDPLVNMLWSCSYTVILIDVFIMFIRTFVFCCIYTELICMILVCVCVCARALVCKSDRAD